MEQEKESYICKGKCGHIIEMTLDELHDEEYRSLGCPASHENAPNDDTKVWKWGYCLECKEVEPLCADINLESYIGQGEIK